MGGRIRILDPSVASKIAAGEVVERPASVAKELIENSLDAGATVISVYVSEGGKRMLRVVDNGSGIEAEDAALAFERSATSKVESEDDLTGITTLGFRGEALYSVAAVSRVELRTRTQGSVAGTRVVVEGGAASWPVTDGCPEGTSIEVSDLFFNTPARQKFLRSKESEYGRIQEVFRNAALANPGVRFRLFRQGASTKPRCVVDAAPGTLAERVRDIFGADVARGLAAVETPFISGLIGPPGATHATSKALYTFVNGRAVRDRSINRAIIDGYGSVIDGLRYPFAVLDIRIPPEDVDVNIHPAKTEVRFASNRVVYEAVKTAVRGTLARSLSSAQVSGAESGGGYGAGSASGQAHGARPYGAWRAPAGAEARRESVWMSGARETARAYSPEAATNSPRTAPLDFEGADADVKTPEFLSLRTVGQVWGEFLIAEGPRRGAGEGENSGGEFFLIDQHGASERCAYERLRQGYYEGGAAPSQMLLLPERIETTIDEAEAVNESLEQLGRLGFELVPFGPSSKTAGETFILKAVPVVVRSRSSAALVKDLAAELAAAGGSTRAEDAIDSALMRIACHSVVRGPRPMTPEEGNALLRELARVDFAAHCPHGRPVVKRYTRRDVESMFGR